MDYQHQFMTNFNLGPGICAIGAALPRPFPKKSTHQLFECPLILHRGIQFCSMTNEHTYLYYKWIGNLGRFLTLTDLMTGQSLGSFIISSFGTTLCQSSTKLFNIRYLSQISGYSFSQRNKNKSLAICNRVMDHQNSLQQDKWFNKPLYPKQEK